MSDLAIVVVAVVALREGLRRGFARLRPSLALWIASAALLIWVFARAFGLAAVLLARRTVGWIGVATGVIGLMLAGATAGLIGTAAGAVGLLYAVARRRRLELRDFTVTGGVVALVAAGVLVLRAG